MASPAAGTHLLLHAQLLLQAMALIPASPAGAILVDAHDPQSLRCQLLHVHSLQVLPPLPPPLVPPFPAAVAANLLLELTRGLLSSGAVALLLPCHELEVLHIPAPAWAPARTIQHASVVFQM